jgi:hypothetical protein
VAGCFEVGDVLEEGGDGSGWQKSSGWSGSWLRMFGDVLVGINVDSCMVLKLGLLGYVLSFASCHCVPEDY